jgi:hypothetical protein
MALVCEDLSSYGVVLIPPGSQQYFDLLADIERRLQDRPQGCPPPYPNAQSRKRARHFLWAAILVNRANVAIATLAYVWSLLLPDGRTVPSSHIPGPGASVLLPFLQHEGTKRFDAYWNRIFPGSKRLIIFEDGIYGDNTDVRAPAPDELWTAGSFFSLGGGGGSQGKPFKLTLDGVFFVDGGFAGPNQLGSWDHLVAAREAYLSASALARTTPQTPAGRADFFARMYKLGGLDAEPRRDIPSALAPLPPPPPPPPPALGATGRDRESIREFQQQSVARTVLRMRGQDDAAAITAIAAWQDTPGPEPHRL